MMTINAWIRQGTLTILICTLFVQTAVAALLNSDRIVVLPFYSEKGIDVTDGGYEAEHYWRVSQSINNQLVRNGFEVHNPVAVVGAEKEYDRLRERVRENSSRAAQEMTRKYGADLAYIVWLDVSERLTDDGYCKARAQVEGEGYDSGGRDIGAGLVKATGVTKRDCEDAIIEAEAEAGDEVGRALVAKLAANLRDGGVQSTPSAATADAPARCPVGGADDPGNLGGPKNLVNVRLVDITQYDVVEVFGKVLGAASGTTEVPAFCIRVEPGVPRASVAVWRVPVEDTSVFQSRVSKTLQEITSRSTPTTGQPSVAHGYSRSEVGLIEGIQAVTGNAATHPQEIVFSGR